MNPVKIADPTILGQNADLDIFLPRENIYPVSILAIHGMWATSRRWENYGRYFSNHGFAFWTPTLRHHFGKNNDCVELGQTSVNDYVHDMAVLIETLKKRQYFAKNPVIFGHSMGGLIALKLATYGLASRLVLLNSAPPAGVRLHADWHYQLAIARYLPELLFQKPFKPSLNIASRFIMNGMPPEQHPALHEGMVYESGRAAWEIKTGKITVDFEKIQCPTLIIGSEQDRIVPSTVALDIAKKMRCPDYNLWVFRSFAHWIQTEGAWSEPAGCVLSWLKERL